VIAVSLCHRDDIFLCESISPRLLFRHRRRPQLLLVGTPVPTAQSRSEHLNFRHTYQNTTAVTVTRQSQQPPEASEDLFKASKLVWTQDLIGSYKFILLTSIDLDVTLDRISNRHHNISDRSHIVSSQDTILSQLRFGQTLYALY